jgi:hypothetical protein
MVPNVGTAWYRFDHAHEKIGTGGEEEWMVREELVTQDPDKAHGSRVEEIRVRQGCGKRFLVLRDKRGMIEKC